MHVGTQVGRCRKMAAFWKCCVVDASECDLMAPGRILTLGEAADDLIQAQHKERPPDKHKHKHKHRHRADRQTNTALGMDVASVAGRVGVVWCGVCVPRRFQVGQPVLIAGDSTQFDSGNDNDPSNQTSIMASPLTNCQ